LSERHRPSRLRVSLDRLLGRPQPPTVDQCADLLRTIQELRLELAESQASLARLRQTVAEQRAGAEARLQRSLQAEMESLLLQAAAPAVQLLTQAHLLEAENQTVKASDVLRVARRLLGVFLERGLEPLGEIGTTVAFDPDLHQALQAGWQPKVGQAVRIRLPGMAYGGRLLHRAGVSE
jgi:molecular chaperone GrpE (heat shock protein)